MAERTLRILCVHGVGNHPPGGPWEEEWKEAIRQGLRASDPGLKPVFAFAHHDHLFAKHKLGFWDMIQATGKLIGSAVTSPFRRPRGLSARLRWTAGMVVQWVENQQLRAETRALLCAKLREFKPDVVCCHSLGSLIGYDAFTSSEGRPLIQGRVLVTFGSQIGNAFVSGNFLAGRVTPLAGAKFWYHLFNPNDDIFTAPIRLSADNFAQVDAVFEQKGVGDHSAHLYLAHEQVAESVWGALALDNRLPRQLPNLDLPSKPRWVRKPTSRALLIGINDYPDPAMRLEGCVNDVFLMSSLLQESGFAADDIRVVLDSRATARGILDRLDWLLADAREGDVRFLYYSGHGAQIPAYGVDERVDRMDEALVAYDFDWTADRAVTDDRFRELYAQLPYEMQFLAMFDCCHSGGLTRGANRVRGLTPPDDIRHRRLEWKDGMWRERDLWTKDGNTELSEVLAIPSAEMARHLNRKLPDSTHPLGQAMALRRLPKTKYDKLRAERGHEGPYMPLLLFACREEELAYEYRHGAIAHGAFTYALAHTLRERRRSDKSVAFEALVGEVAEKLADLRYDQHPHLVGPTVKRKAPVPMLAKFGATEARKGAKKKAVRRKPEKK